MDKERIAIQLVRCLLEEGENIDFEQGIYYKKKNKHYRILVESYDPSEIEKLMESVLYPAAAGVCEYCGK